MSKAGCAEENFREPILVETRKRAWHRQFRHWHEFVKGVKRDGTGKEGDTRCYHIHSTT